MKFIIGLVSLSAVAVYTTQGTSIMNIGITGVSMLAAGIIIALVVMVLRAGK